MALSDEVTSRYSFQRLKEMTNDGDPTASSINTTVLGLAATDIQADFETLSNESFDLTKASHVVICVPAVMGKLYEYQGKLSPYANESMDVFVARCNRLREGNLPAPLTNSNIVVETKTTEYKNFRPSHFKDYTPGSRGGGSYKEDND